MIGLSKTALEELPYIPTMLNNRSIHGLVLGSTHALVYLTVLAPFAGAQTLPSDPPATASPSARSTQPAGPAAAPDKPDEPATEPELFLDAAAKKLGALNSVAADVEESVDMLGQKFTLKGRYLKAPGRRVYLRLSVAGLPDSGGTMLQVCDGETLWDYQQVLEAQYYRRLSVKPVMERLSSPDLDPRLREQATAQMGFAGPETLLLGLRKVMKFDQKEPGELDGRKVWLFRGTWKSRQGLVMPNNQPVPPTGALPFYVPSDATLYLGVDDSWPYKLVLVGRQTTDLIDTRRRGPDGRVVGSQRSIEKPTPSRIELSYLNVKLNPTIKVEEFAFTAPPQAQVEDNTEAIVKGLDKALESEAARKKSEAAKKDGAVLDQSIDVSVPKSPSTP